MNSQRLQPLALKMRGDGEALRSRSRVGNRDFVGLPRRLSLYSINASQRENPLMHFQRT